MSTPSRPLLEAHPVSEDARTLYDEIRRLNAHVKRLNEELEELRNAKQEAQQAQRTLTRLRHHLEPQYRAMQDLFGELDSAGIEATDHADASVGPRITAAWETWKRKLGGKQAEFIQAMLEHGDMTAIQLKIATHSGTSTVGIILGKLRDLGLIAKNGSKWSLKEL